MERQGEEQGWGRGSSAWFGWEGALRKKEVWLMPRSLTAATVWLVVPLLEAVSMGHGAVWRGSWRVQVWYPEA